jgi:hypothetical protein
VEVLSWACRPDQPGVEEVSMSNGSDPAVAKRGMSPWAWVAIGCGVVVLVVVLIVVAGSLFVAKKVSDVAADFKDNPALAAARLVVKANPDLEEVEVDEKAGTITVRHRSTGEVVTVSFEDLKEGRLKFSTDKGEVTISGDEGNGTFKVEGSNQEGGFSLRAGAVDIAELPEWVPRYPGGEVGGTYLMEQAGSANGGYQVTTADAVDVVLEHFRKELKDQGFEVKISTISGDGQLEGGTLNASLGGGEGSQRSVHIMVARQDGGATATVGFTTGE